MKKEKVTLTISQFPEELRIYTEKATLYDSSSHSGATVLYLDTGYYLKIDQKGKLAREAQCAKWFDKQGIGVPVLTYISQDRDYLLTKEASGISGLEVLDQPEVLCQTMATALRQLHNLQPVHFPTNSLLKNYIQLAEENYQKGLFYEKALLPQFQIRSRKEAYQLIQEQGHLLTRDAFIHGDACLPNFILKDAKTFSCFIDVGLSGFSDRHIDLYWAIWSLNYNLGNPKYGDLFLDYYGRENINSEKLRLIAAFEAFG